MSDFEQQELGEKDEVKIIDLDPPGAIPFPPRFSPAMMIWRATRSTTRARAKLLLCAMFIILLVSLLFLLQSSSFIGGPISPPCLSTSSLVLSSQVNKHAFLFSSHFSACQKIHTFPDSATDDER